MLLSFVLSLEAFFAFVFLAFFLYAVVFPAQPSGFGALLALQKAHDLFKVWNYTGVSFQDAEIVFPGCCVHVAYNNTVQENCAPFPRQFFSAEGTVFPQGLDIPFEVVVSVSCNDFP